MSDECGDNLAAMFLCFLLQCLYGSGEHGKQFLDFLLQVTQAALGENLAFYQKIDPVISLFQLLQAKLDLADEFCGRPRSLCLSVVSSNRSP